ncbi:cation transporter [Thermosipho ferrireducens]|uniref:Cation transporter n=1 Tax=Thermosipho ferrireducens TaxID=2571116 RepID=A0ABX7S7H9_9BACT|nr:cation diffusion facilitator family transporter [Thermosipho ferrireducens]QTA37868.1 cation transporter [Thermosipho ferrireducens]
MNQNIIKRVAFVALLTNTILAGFKVFVGILFNSMAVLADGIDTSTDILTSTVVLISTKISAKPPDETHPYGHQKSENIGAKIVSFVIFYAGVSLLIESIKRLVTGNYFVITSFIPLLITIVSLIGKTFLFIIEYKTGKKYNSASMLAEALNMRNDILLSTLVFLGVFFNKLGIPWMDPVVGVIMSGIIIKVAFEIFTENVYDLMDGLKPEDMWIYNTIFNSCKECDGVYNPHKVRVRKIGNLYDIDMDIEVSPHLTVSKAHDLTLCLKKKILSKTDRIFDVVIHVEPIGNLEKEPFGLGEKNEKINDDFSNNSINNNPGN